MLFENRIHINFVLGFRLTQSSNCKVTTKVPNTATPLNSNTPKIDCEPTVLVIIRVVIFQVRVRFDKNWDLLVRIELGKIFRVLVGFWVFSTKN